MTTERTPAEYAIEHGEYLAQSAEALLDFLNGLDEDDPFADHDSWADLTSGLRGSIYEFRKRATRAKEKP